MNWRSTIAWALIVALGAGAQVSADQSGPGRSDSPAAAAAHNLQQSGQTPRAKTDTPVRPIAAPAPSRPQAGDARSDAPPVADGGVDPAAGDPNVPSPEGLHDSEDSGVQPYDDATVLDSSARTSVDSCPTPAGPFWRQVDVDGPPPRARHAMVYDENRQRVVLFGGSFEGAALGDTWEWDGASWTFMAMHGPSPRYWHAMAYDAGRQVVVLFGGQLGSSQSRETWEWDGEGWTLRSNGGPTSREQHAMAYDRARGVTVLFGGLTGGARSRENWEWDGTTWTQRPTGGPTPRYWHTMAYDEARGRVALFGGWDGDYKNDTWEWNGDFWTPILGNPPTPRYTSMAYDHVRQRLVVFGGWRWPDRLGDTWELDGNNWYQRTTTGPDPRQRHAIAYDAARNSVVLFGGRTTDHTFGDTWVLPSTEMVIDAHPVNAAALDSGTVVFSVAASGTDEIEYRWRREGIELFDGPTGTGSVISGSDTHALTISNVGPADDGAYDVQLTDGCGWSIVGDSAHLIVLDCLIHLDLDGDGEVGLGDLSILLSNIGATGDQSAPTGDINGDGVVDEDDLSLLLEFYGMVCP